MDRVAIFIDGGYLARLLRDGFRNTRIDFDKLSEILARDLTLLRTYYYYCMPYQHDPPTDDERKRFSKADRFINALKKIPRYEVRLGRLARRESGFVQKGVDVHLAVDLVKLALSRQINQAILITGDSDFVPAIQVAKDAGVLVQLYYSRISVHNSLLDSVDEAIEISSDLINECRRD
ncbi:MAG: NYN domain-containing protein [Promethearchaeota archaeon]